MHKLNRHTTIGFIGALLIAAPAYANDDPGDGGTEQARVLLEEARTFGKPDVTGLAAGQIEAERERPPEVLDENEMRWRDIAESQSYN